MSPRPILLLLLALAACRRADPPLLQLNGETVSVDAFHAYVAEVESRQGVGTLDAETRRGLLEAFLEQRALVIEARRRGLLRPGAPADEELAAVSTLLAEAVRPAAVSENEIERWSARNAASLRAPERVSLRQILVPTLNEARDVRRRLNKDPRGFDSLARSLSKGPEAAIGGYLGSFERGQLPAELEAAAFALPEGGTSDPIQSPFGYHVLRVESRQQARQIPPEEARERIREQLERDQRAAAERAFVAEIMAQAKVNHDAALRPPAPPPS